MLLFGGTCLGDLPKPIDRAGIGKVVRFGLLSRGSLKQVQQSKLALLFVAERQSIVYLFFGLTHNQGPLEESGRVLALV